MFFLENGFESMALETLILKGNDLSSSSSPSSLILTSGATGRINALLSVRALKSLLMLINTVVLLLLLPFRGRRSVSTVEKHSKEEKQTDCQRKGVLVRFPFTFVPWKSGNSVGCNGTASTACVNAVDQAVAARRATAIRRLVEDDDPNTSRDFWLLLTKRGDTIFTQSWTPISVKIR